MINIPLIKQQDMNTHKLVFGVSNHGVCLKLAFGEMLRHRQATEAVTRVVKVSGPEKDG